MKKKNNFEIINNDFRNLYIHCEKLAYVQNMNNKHVTFRQNRYTQQYEFGIRHERIDKNNYECLFCDYINNNKWTIRFTDSSYITLYYKFNINKELVECSLNYVPACLDANECDLLSKYIRIDYDTLGYKQFIHTKVHLHISIYKNEIRIPCERVFTPSEFLYFILIHVYHSIGDNFKYLNLKEKIDIPVLDSKEAKTFKFN